MENYNWTAKKADDRFVEITQEPICYCDTRRRWLLGKCSALKLQAYMKREFFSIAYRLILECPEIHHPPYRCPQRCDFKEKYPEVMLKVYKKLLEEKKWKERDRHYC